MRGRTLLWAILMALVIGVGLALPWLRREGILPAVVPGPAGDASTGVTHVVFRGAIAPSGVIEVRERVTFAGEEGGTVAVPPPCGDVLRTLTGCVRDVEVDGRRARTRVSLGTSVIDIRAPAATLTYRLESAVRGFTDIAHLQAVVLAQDPLAAAVTGTVRLQGRLRLPPGVEAREVEPYLFAGDPDRRAVARAGEIRFFANPGGTQDAELHAALPPDAVPGLPSDLVIEAPGRPAFDIVADVRSRASDLTSTARAGAEDVQRIVDLVFSLVGFGVAALLWIAAIGLAIHRRMSRAPIPPVPERLEDPPGPEDPALVSVLMGRGRPAAEAVAGNVLALADRKVLGIQQLSGERFLIRILDPRRGGYAADVLLVEQLRLAAGPDGTVEGPPVWRRPGRWYRSFRNDAVGRAQLAGMARRVFSPVLLGAASIWTGVGIGLNFFLTDPIMFTFAILAITVAGQLLSAMSGYALTDYGRLQRERWRAYGRYLQRFEQLDEVGPGGVVIWGPRLAYGVVLDAARTAARALTPDV